MRVLLTILLFILAIFAALGLLPSLTMPALAVRLRNPFPLVVVGFSAFLIAFAGLLFAPMKAPWLWAVLLGIGVTAAYCLSLRNKARVSGA